jgi:hypothetical protein
MRAVERLEELSEHPQRLAQAFQAAMELMERGMALLEKVVEAEPEAWANMVRQLSRAMQRRPVVGAHTTQEIYQSMALVRFPPLTTQAVRPRSCPAGLVGQKLRL